MVLDEITEFYTYSVRSLYNNDWEKPRKNWFHDGHLKSMFGEILFMAFVIQGKK